VGLLPAYEALCVAECCVDVRARVAQWVVDVAVSVEREEEEAVDALLGMAG
jgi:hypothetical protein